MRQLYDLATEWFSTTNTLPRKITWLSLDALNMLRKAGLNYDG